MPSAEETSTAVAVTAPEVTDDAVRWTIPAAALPDGSTDLSLQLDWPASGSTEFERADDATFRLRWDRPLAHRFEYQLRAGTPDGEHTLTDPSNPRVVPGPFGDKSEIVFPDYAEPDWLGTPADGRSTAVDDPPSDLEVPVPIRVYTPAGVDDDAAVPLLISHDGTDMAERGALLSWASAQAAAGLPLRVALLDPPHGYRNAWYAANPAYSDHLAERIVPALVARFPTTVVVGLGASLGALAMLYTHRRHPSAFAGLGLQSGSFFTPELDPQESSWPEFAQVCSAVDTISSALPPQVHPIPIWMSVGAVEENRANNEQLAGALTFQGYPVDAEIVPDAHTVIGWRDAWQPGLAELIRATMSR